MASFDRDRVARFSWNALRYALGPVGGLAMPWLVIHRSEVNVWGQVVTPMILVQLSVHLLAWGNKDLLLRAFSKPGAEVGRLWLSNCLTRAPFMALFVISLLILPAPVIPAAWTMIWCLGLFISNAVEPLIVQRKLFGGAFLADLCGLVVQFVLIAKVPVVDLPTICRSFAIGQAVRAILLVFISGAAQLIASPWGISSRSATSLFQAHVVLAIPFFLIGVSGLLGSRVDLYVLNVLVDREQAGIYQVVSGLFLQCQVLPGLIAMPFTRELYRLGRSSMWRASARLARLGALLIAPFTMIAWLLFKRVFGFDLPWTLYLVGALVILPAYAYVPLINLLFKHHQERSVMWANFFAAAIMVLLTFLLVPAWGIVGALFAAAAGQWAILTAVVRSSRRLASAAH